MNKTALLTVVAAGALLAGCERPVHDTAQIGYRGTGAEGVIRTSLETKLHALNVVPPPPYDLPKDEGGPRAATEYQNVKVLGDLSVDEFNYTMAAITAWIAPAEQGCNYCHNPENMASDAVYTKVVARKMLQMTRNINSNWTTHVKATGVTCYTCHRGNAVPKYVWNETPDRFGDYKLKGNKHGQNTPGQNSVALASLPYDPFTQYLLKANQIRLAGPVADRTDHRVSMASAEGTYGLMMHMSNSLGVNCSYCHNAGNFQSWRLSRPQRAVAWYGIRMVRDINNNYINAVGNVMPANRLGPLGDPYKANCTTCHQGVYKPLYGVSMLKDYPGLRAPHGTVVNAPAENADLRAKAAADEAAGDAATPADPAAPVAAPLTPVSFTR